MELTLWTYEGPPHVGAMRIAASMSGLHYVLHAPQGDTYADLLFTMIERRSTRPPVTYTTFEARDLGGDTAELFKTAVRDAYERWAPQAMLVGASCTAELLQDDPGGLARALRLPIPVIPLELPAYQKKENWGASETFYRLVRSLVPAPSARVPDARPPLQHSGADCARLSTPRRCARNLRHPQVARRGDLRHSAPRRHARGHHSSRRSGLQRRALPRDRPTRGKMVGKEPQATVHSNHSHRRRRDARLSSKKSPHWPGSIPPQRLMNDSSRSPWYSRSVDSTYLTDKRVLHFRRRHSRDRSGARRANRARLQGRGLGNLFERVRPRGAERGRSLRSRSAYRRRLSGSRGEGHRAAAGTHSRHPDGAPHRQAARNSLRRHLRTDLRSGLPGPIFSADGFRRRECAVRTPGFIP